MAHPTHTPRRRSGPPRNPAQLLTALGIAVLSIVQPPEARAQDCGNPFSNHFGPFDYRSASASDKRIVETRHFTPGVESMTRPSTTTFERMAQDVAYTLHVFPNHHRALVTMTRLGERHRAAQPPGAAFSVDCYYRRAVQYAPDDTVARALYAQFLSKHGRKDAALQQLAFATEHAGDNPLSHFNIGLVYLDVGEADRAAVSARRARELGYPRTELVDRLKALGRWTEADAPADAASAASSAGA